VKFAIFSAQQHTALCTARYRPSVRPSVRPPVSLSVTRVDQSKAVQVRIMKFSPHHTVAPSV